MSLPLAAKPLPEDPKGISRMNAGKSPDSSTTRCTKKAGERQRAGTKRRGAEVRHATLKALPLPTLCRFFLWPTPNLHVLNKGTALFCLFVSKHLKISRQRRENE